MTALLTSARKTGAAILGACVAFGVLVLLSEPAKIQPEEWASGLIGLATALGVWKATNTAPPAPAGERGASTLVTVLVVIALLLAILWLLDIRVHVG